MPGGFAPRFALEAGFLILLGVGAGYADLRTAVIVALLGGGWVLVSLLELAVWRLQARPFAAYVPAPVAAAEELKPDADVGSGAAEGDSPVDDTEYPLRAGAGEPLSEEVEEYTRVLGGDRQGDPPVEAAE
jgi:hypothetical protein